MLDDRVLATSAHEHRALVGCQPVRAGKVGSDASIAESHADSQVVLVELWRALPVIHRREGI